MPSGQETYQVVHSAALMADTGHTIVSMDWANTNYVTIEAFENIITTNSQSRSALRRNHSMTAHSSD